MSRARGRSTAREQTPDTQADIASVWVNAVAQLRAIADVHQRVDQCAADANKLQAQLRRHTESVPRDMAEQLVSLYKRGISGSEEEQHIAKEALDILIALRQSTEASSLLLSGAGHAANGSADDGRRKRKPDADADSGGHRKRRARSQSIAPDALHVSAPVAFRIPQKTASEEEWIQCVILKITGEGAKQRFEVQDSEPDDTGKPGEIFRTTAQNLIPLPMSRDSLQPLAAGQVVLARYPETTVFYPARFQSMRRDGICKLIFEGDQGKETEVDRMLVLERPAPGGGG